MKNPWVLVGIIFVLLFGGAIWFSNSANKESNEGVVVADHITGNAEAAVTLVEYSDFQCPACAAFHPVVKQLLATYGDKIKFEYRHFPLPIHNYSQQAALAAEAAGQQDKFYEYSDLLFQNQQTWSTSATPIVFFEQYASDLGLDVATFKRHMGSSLLRDAVKEDMAKAREEGLTGTPTFFLNGQKMEMETFDDFLSQIIAAVDPTGVSLLNATNTASSSVPGVKFGI